MEAEWRSLCIIADRGGIEHQLDYIDYETYNI
jgi:hypothetical protein